MIRKAFWNWMKPLALFGAEDEPETEEAGSEEEESEESTETRQVTAKELETMTARAADKASRKSKRDLAVEYGFENFGAFKEFIDSSKQAQESAQTEQERKLAEAEKSQKDYEAKARDLARKELNLQVSTAVVGAGVSDKKRIDRIAALVQMGLDPEILEDEDAWDEAITASLQEVKTDMPELFSKAGSAGSGDGGARGGSAPKTDEEAEAQKALQDKYLKRGLVVYSE